MSQTAVKVGNGEITKLMSTKAGSLSLATIQAYFPGACGLANQSGAVFSMEKRGDNIWIEPPEGGWDPNCVYEVQYPVGHKRGSEALESPHTGPPWKIFKNDKPPTEAQKFAHMLFEAMDGGKPTGRCFLAVAPHYAISYSHTAHERFNIGDILTIRSMEEKSQYFTVEVREKLPAKDLLLTRSREPLIPYQPSFLKPNAGQHLVLVGIERYTTDTELVFSRGIVYSDHLTNNGFLQGAYSSKPGRSGSGVFTEGTMAIVGMHVAKEDLQNNGRRLDVTASMTNYLGNGFFVPSWTIQELFLKHQGIDDPETLKEVDPHIE